ncbi:hypothetical protein ACO0R3_002223 [Hanseniaspora guilliermondii]
MATINTKELTQDYTVSAIHEINEKFEKLDIHSDNGILGLDFLNYKTEISNENNSLNFDLQKEYDSIMNYLNEKLKNIEINKTKHFLYMKKLEDLKTIMYKSINGSAVAKGTDFDQLIKFNDDLTNINQSIEYYHKFVQFENICHELDTLITELTEDVDFLEISDDEFINGDYATKILYLHNQINELKKFEQIVKKLSSFDNTDKEIANIINKFFMTVEKYDIIKEKFNKFTKNLITDLVDFIRSERFIIILIFFKILERDTEEDMEILDTLNFLKTKQESLTIVKKVNTKKFLKDDDEAKDVFNNLLCQEIIKNRVGTRLIPNKMIDFFIETLNNEVTDMFGNLESTYHLNTPEINYEVLDNLEWIMNELLVVFDHLYKFCWSKFPIREIYFKVYYEHLNNLILKIIGKEPDFNNLVKILQLDQIFLKFFDKDLKFKTLNWESPSIMGEKEKELLINDYLNLLSKKMDEWVHNIKMEETALFVKRDKEPSFDENKNLWILDLKNLFQMFIQQMDLCCDIGYIQIFLGCFNIFTKLILKRQREWITLIKAELKKWIDYNQSSNDFDEAKTGLEEPAGGFLEYLIAVTNDQMKGADLTVMVQDKYTQLVSAKHKDTIDSEIDLILDGYADVAKVCTNAIIDLILDDVKDNLTLVLSSKWYVNDNDTLILQTINILQDYLQDIQQFMNEYVFVTFLENLLEEIVINYIESLNYKPMIVKKKIIIGFKKDLEMLFKFFQNYKPKKEEQTEEEEEDYTYDEMLESKFKILEYFIDLICCPLSLEDNVEDFKTIWSNLVESYYDCPLSLIHRIVRLRIKEEKEVSTNSSTNNTIKMNQLFDSCQEIKDMNLKHVKETSLDMNPVPTFVAKLNIN